MSQKATILTKEVRIPQKTFDLKGLLIKSVKCFESGGKI